jgi:predicted DNA-binding protein YlxM (UPF0122 family)
MSKKITLNEAQIAQVEALAAYLSISQIADYFGFSKRAFYDIRKRQPEVLAAYNKGLAKACSFVGNMLMGFIREKENTASKLSAITFYLRTRGGWGGEYKNDNEVVCLTFSDEQTPAEIFNIGFNALKEGKIDFTQMQQIGNLAITKMNIENNGSNEDKIVYQQRSREEALKFAAKMKEARENLRLVNESNTKAN